MYSSEIINQFIELRSQNVSLEKIAKTLGINKSTAIDWQTRYKAQIDEIRAFHLEAIRERLATRYEDELEYAMSELKRIRAELKTRDFDYEPTGFLHHAEAAAYRRVQKLCAMADFPSTARTAAPPANAAPCGNPQFRITNPEPTASVNSPPASPESKIEDPEPTASVNPPPVNPESRIANPESASSKEPQTDPTEIQPFPHQNNGGSVTPPPPAKSESEIHTPPSPIENRQSQIESPLPPPAIENQKSQIENPIQPRLAQLDPDDPNFYDESIVIDPKESARSILERYGVKLPNKKDLRLIRPV